MNFKVSMDILKNYFLLIKEILSFKTVDNKYAFYLSSATIPNRMHKLIIDSKRPINEQLKFIIPHCNSDILYDMRYLNQNLYLNDSNIMDNDRLLLTNQINSTVATHNYYLNNFVKEIINGNNSRLRKYNGLYNENKLHQFKEENLNKLKELSNKIDDYDIWLYDYKMKYYFNDNYEIIYKFSEYEDVDTNKLFQAINNAYNNKLRNYDFYFYSFCTAESVYIDRGNEKDLFINDLRDIICKGKSGILRGLPYRPYAIVKNNKGNDIRILLTVYDKHIDDICYKVNKKVADNRFKYDGITGEIIININNNKEIINYLNNWI